MVLPKKDNTLKEAQGAQRIIQDADLLFSLQKEALPYREVGV